MRIKEVLKEKRVTQKELAERMGISLSAVKQMVGASSLTTDTLRKMAEALEVEIWEFFTTSQHIASSTPNSTTEPCPHCGKPITIRTSIE